VFACPLRRFASLPTEIVAMWKAIADDPVRLCACDGGHWCDDCGAEPGDDVQLPAA
jgi:hypothetical protein